jgi:ribosomal RNA-processing protein 9
MPDPFFASKHRKRKREDSSTKAGPSGAKKVARKVFGNLTRKTSATTVNGASKTKKTKAVDEELSDESDEGPGGGIEDMDLRADEDGNAEGSGEEDEDETPAEKRLRLAKLYIESVKEGLGKLHSI